MDEEEIAALIRDAEAQEEEEEGAYDDNYEAEWMAHAAQRTPEEDLLSPPSKAPPPSSTSTSMATTRAPIQMMNIPDDETRNDDSVPTAESFTSFFTSIPILGRKELAVTLPRGGGVRYLRLESTQSSTSSSAPHARLNNLLSRPIAALLKSCEEKAALSPPTTTTTTAEGENDPPLLQPSPSSPIVTPILKKDGRSKRRKAQKSLTDKYKPRRFQDLLTHERTAREVLKWITQVGGAPSDNNNNGDGGRGGKRAWDSGGKSFFNTPPKRVVLLGGPPGAGKTTLAHVLAHHAGYRVIEVNASDDRTPHALVEHLVSATQSQSVFGTRRKNLIVLDEVDGATEVGIQAVIDALPSVGGPVIAICNDLFHPALRSLRQVAAVVPVHLPARPRLVRRLRDVCEEEGISLGPGALEKLCARMGDDVRACLTALDFWRSSLLLPTSGSSSSPPVFDVTAAERLPCAAKDTTADLWTSWRRVLLKSSVSSPHALMESLGKHLGSDFDLFLEGLRENYLRVPRAIDSSLENMTNAAEWFALGDALQRRVSDNDMDFSFWGYLPAVPVGVRAALKPSTAVLSGYISLNHRPGGKPSSSPNTIAFPHAAIEFSRRRVRREAIYEEMSAMLPFRRRGCGRRGFFTEVGPLLARILVPSGQNDVPSREELKRHAELLEELEMEVRPDAEEGSEEALARRHHRLLNSGFSPLGPRYVLHPAILELVLGYDGDDAAHNSPGEVSAQQWLQAIEVVISTNASPLKRRRRDVSSALPGRAEENGVRKRSSHEKRREEEEEQDTSALPDPLPSLPKRSHVRRDFFGRPILVKEEDDVALRSTSSDRREEGMSGSKIPHDILFRFNEGFSDAVRRPIKMKDLFT